MSPIIQGDFLGSSTDKDTPYECAEEGEPRNIQEKVATTVLNTLQLTLWLHLCVEDP